MSTIQESSDPLALLLGKAGHGKKGKKPAKADVLLSMFADTLAHKLGKGAEGLDTKAAPMAGLPADKGLFAGLTVAGKTSPLGAVASDATATVTTPTDPTLAGTQQQALPGLAGAEDAGAEDTAKLLVPVQNPVALAEAAEGASPHEGASPGLAKVDGKTLELKTDVDAKGRTNLPGLPADPAKNKGTLEWAAPAAMAPKDPTSEDGKAMPALSAATGLPGGLQTAASTGRAEPGLSSANPTALGATSALEAGDTSTEMLAAHANARVQPSETGMGRLTAQIASPLNTSQWAAELGDKMIWMANRQGGMAELTLNPPSLGSIEVRLNLNGSEAGAQFFSANPAVRDAIETAMPRLRDMLSTAGLSLGEAMVSSESFQSNPQARQSRGSRAQAESEEAETQGVQAIPGHWQGNVLAGSGRVDLYA